MQADTRLSFTSGRRWDWPFRARRPRLLVVYSFRYDAHLVPALIENTRPFADGWVALDDRAGRGVFTNEPARRRVLLDRARAEGADWVLAVDPDERLEASLAARLPDLLRVPGPQAYSFALREMYAVDRYRVDGIWGRKRQTRLFTLDGVADYTMDLHSQWVPPGSPHRIDHLDINLYHLKMISPARRAARRDLYNRLDPARQRQAIGYDYLADETGAAFEAIPVGRGYRPGHVEDGGLWMGDPGGGYDQAGGEP